VAASFSSDGAEWLDGVLELADGSAYRGISFGAEGKSISGECVFQTGLAFSRIYWNIAILKN
jgi:carbamoyl-phosphate synthase/aspartate carbamoyltransferase